MGKKNQTVNYQKAMEMLNQSLQEMKRDMSEVNAMELDNSKNEMANHMRSILEKIQTSTDQYSKSHDTADLNSVCLQLEVLKPSFSLNYNEICYDNSLNILNDTLSSMTNELKEIDNKTLNDNQKDKVKKMHTIYDEISSLIHKYASSHDQSDFKLALNSIEVNKPQFILNYNELCL